MIEEVYRRIAEHAGNPIFIHVVPQEEALARAKAARGPLAGVPFAVKDNIDVAGMPTTAACRSFSHVPKGTAPAVQKLLDAGAVLVGKTNLDQFATGLVGTRSPYGACRNAFDPAYISGGSSSGSAVAVALGMAHFALGTDTAGSGRVPAAFNNLVGLKPTRGRVSTEGVVPACRSLDCVSILAKTCRDALSILDIAGEKQDSTSFPPAPRFAVPRQLEFHGDRAYAGLFAEALSRFDKVVEIDFEPFLEVQKLLYGPWVAERLADLERYLPDMLPVTRQVIEAGRRYTAAELFKAMHELKILEEKCRGDWDVLIVPGAPTIYRIAEVEADPLELNSRLGRYTNFVNLLDLAAITVPAGFRPDGLPFGITLIGPAGSDAALAALGAKFNKEPDTEIRSSIKLAVIGAHLSGMPLPGGGALEMKTITEEYRRLQQELHKNPNYGVASLAFAPLVADLIRSTKAASVSDYGAGKKNLVKGLADAGIVLPAYHPYDPAFPEYGPPMPADLVCCIDVLEHIEPELVDNVVAELASITTRLGFFTIHMGPAAKVLADGRNAHLIQKPSSWWLEKLIRHFDILQLQTHQMMGVGFWVLVRPRAAAG